MNKSVRDVILVGFLLRVAVSVWNGFFGPSPGADLDAIGLNEFASEVAITGVLEDIRIGYVPYTNALGLVYGIAFNHVFFGSLLSSLAWLLSAYVLYKSFLAFSPDVKQLARGMQIYSFLPTSILFTAVTIREPYQLLFLNVALFSLVKIVMHRKLGYWVLLLAAAVCASSLHGAILAFCVIFLLGGVFVYFVGENKVFSLLNIFMLGLVFAAVASQGADLFGKISYSLDEGVVDAIQLYQSNLLGIDARTTYKSATVSTGISGVFVSFSTGFFQYLFEPFPWRISSAEDVLIFGENVLKCFVIWRACGGFSEDYSRGRRLLNFVFISYALLELIWSVGTTNWGTSVRHHIPSLGFLLLAAYASGSATRSPIGKALHCASASKGGGA